MSCVARINESCVAQAELTSYVCLSLPYHNGGPQMDVNDDK